MNLNLAPTAETRREAAVNIIKERSEETLDQNFANTMSVLGEYHRELSRQEPFSFRRFLNFNRRNLQNTEAEFAEYFDTNLFNGIVHTTRSDLGDEVTLKSPSELGSAAHSGELDREIGNTRYIFASANNLRSNSSYHPYEDELKSDNCHVVPLDLGHQRNYPGGEARLLEVYGKNIYRLEDFKKVFARYCAIVFDSPEEAILFFQMKSQSRYTEQADAWTDESIEWNGKTEKEKQFFKRMQYLYLEKGIVPPFSPEFQFRDKVVGKKIERKHS